MKIKIILLFLLVTPAFGNTAFETLCKSVLDHNLELANAEYESKSAHYEKNSSLAILLPAINFQGNLFYNYDLFQKEYPESGIISGNISQYFLGGSTLSISGTFIYYNTESNTVSYEPSATANLELTQSLCPWWFSFKSKNPDFYIPKLNYIAAKNKQESTQFSVLNNFLLLFLEYKDLINQIDIAEKQKKYYKEMYDSNLELYNKGNSAFINLFETNQKYVEACTKYDGLLNQKNEYLNKFNKITNYDFEKEKLDKILECCVEEQWEKVFLQQFPQWNYDNYTDLSCKMLETTLTYEKSKYLLERQQLAPKLTAGIQCDYDVETKHNFAIYVGMDLSSLFSPENLSLKKNYKIKKSNLELQMDNQKKFNANTKIAYEEYLQLLQQQYKECYIEVSAMEKIYKDYKDLYIKGACTKLDFMNIEIAFFQLQNKLNNCQNKLFYYSILLNIEILK